MKLAISNIAWTAEREPSVFDLLREHKVSGIEVAPTRVWPEWEDVTVAAAESYRHQLRDHGFEIPALQAILYGRPELQVFQSSTHEAFSNHIRHIAEIAAALGAPVLVFGSPKNRRRGQLSFQSALAIAVELFSKLGEICSSHGVTLAIEPNPVEYACDFLTNVADVRTFVDEVGCDGLQLHLDSGGMHLCGGSVAETITAAGGFAHYHASEPMLKSVGTEVPHIEYANALRGIGYDGWVSIEMRPPEQLESLTKALEVAADAYLA